MNCRFPEKFIIKHWYLFIFANNVVKGRGKGGEKNIENESIIVSTSLITHAMKRV